jgi:REP-associated tyrosine transposase
METFRITDDASVYFITCTVVDWLPVFVSHDTFSIITDSLTHCHRHKDLRVNAFVIMPTHLHAIVFDRNHDSRNLKLTLDAFRKHTGRALADWTAPHMPSAFGETMKNAARHDRIRQFWQDTYHPIAIESEKFWRQKFDYLHANPVRKGLIQYPDHWRYSSAAYYEGETEYGGDTPITQLDWR